MNLVYGFCSESILNQGKQGRNLGKMREKSLPVMTDTLPILHVAEMPLNSCHTPFCCGVLLNEKRLELFEEMKNRHALTKSGVHLVEGRRGICAANGNISYSKQSC